jgi:hypothetical protein
MRISIRAGRRRILAITAGLLLSGSAIAVTTMSAAQALPSPVKVDAIAAQVTNPLSEAIDLPITASDSDLTGLPLVFTATNLPAGLGIATDLNGTDATISGTITAPFAGTVDVFATDADANVSNTVAFTWTADNTVGVSNPGAQTSHVGTAVAPVTITATDDDGAALPVGDFAPTGLPPGLGIDPGSGVISGTPTAPGTYQATVTATDTEGATGTSTPFTWTVANVVTVDAPGAEQSYVGIPIKPVTITATDTTPGLAYTFASPNLPAGLAINKTTGVITGTPTGKAGTYASDVNVTDSTGVTGTGVIDWTIGKPDKIDVTGPAAKTSWRGVAVSLKVSATDAAAGQTLTWSATGLPPGLTIDPTTGVISGRPTLVGSYALHTVTVTATDGTGSFGSATIKWSITLPVQLPWPGTQTTTVGQWLDINPFPYNDLVPGDKPTFSATGLPSGMSFQNNPMLIWGWPTTAGTYRVTIHEQGSLGSTDFTAFNLIVKAAPGVGATGQIHLPLAGKCLQNPNGTRVELEGCVSGATESWTVESDNTIRVHGRCLTIAGNGSSAGDQLVLSGCAGSASQRWAQGNHGELVNPASGLCVTDPGASKRNGTVPVTGTCHTSSYEQWTLPAQKVLTALGGSCLDTSGAAAIGQRIDMFWCKYSGSSWTFEPNGTIAIFGTECITVKNKKAVIGKCSARNNSQKWTVVRTSAMGSELAQGGVCLAIPSMTSARGTAIETNGTQLITAKCSNTDPRDLWHIE